MTYIPQEENIPASRQTGLDDNNGPPHVIGNTIFFQHISYVGAIYINLFIQFKTLAPIMTLTNTYLLTKMIPYVHHRPITL